MQAPETARQGNQASATDTFFIRASATGIEGDSVVFNSLTLLEGDLSSGGVVFGRRTDKNNGPTTYYTGLLNGTDVGRHIDNEKS